MNFKKCSHPFGECLMCGEVGEGIYPVSRRRRIFRYVLFLILGALLVLSYVRFTYSIQSNAIGDLYLMRR